MHTGLCVLCDQGIFLDTDADEVGGVSRAQLEAEVGQQDGGAAAAAGDVEELGEAEGVAEEFYEEGPPLLWWEYKPAEQKEDEPFYGPYEGSHMLAWAMDG